MQSGPALWLRGGFALDCAVARATAYLSGLGWSELWVNGHRIGDAALSPALADYSRRVPYMTLDLTDSLRLGANPCGVVLGNGRFRAPRPSARDFGGPRLRLQIEIAFIGGGTTRVLADQAWRVTDTGPIRSNNEYDGETYDARQELDGWSEPGFDAATWRAAQPMPAPEDRMAAILTEPTRSLRVIPPVAIVSRLGARVFDFGQNIAGVCRVTAAGASGTSIVIRHAETLHPDGALAVENLRSAQATDRLVLDGGALRIFQPRFTTHGFRYAELAWCETARVEAVEFADDLRRTGHFTCSNPLINRIHDAIAATIRANCRSIRTDCPQRDERQGWLGDPAGGWRGEAMMFSNAAFYAKRLDDIADTQRPDVALSDVAPNYWPVYEDDMSWPAAFVAVAGLHLEHHDDPASLRRHFAAMRAWLAHIGGYIQGTILPPRQIRRLGRTARGPSGNPSRRSDRQTPGALIATAYYIRCRDLMARYAALLGFDPGPDAAEAARLRAAFHANFFDATARQYGRGEATSTILVLAFDLVPAEYRPAAAAQLLAAIVAAEGHVCFGLIGAQWVYSVLYDLGHADIAYAMATKTSYPGFGYMIDRGATTLWELWNGDTADPARNHTMLMGDFPAWLYSYIGSISPDPARPGFVHIRIVPHPVGDLTWAETTYDSPHGRVAVRWELDGSRLRIVAVVPPNTTATLTPPPGSHGSNHEPRTINSGRHEVLLEWYVPPPP